jgi:hypothetical protein
MRKNELGVAAIDRRREARTGVSMPRPGGRVGDANHLSNDRSVT